MRTITNQLAAFSTPEDVIHHAAFSTREAAIHQGDEMSDQTTKGRNRKLMMLGGLGLGLAMLGRKRRWRRYAMSQMMGGGYAGGPWGRFGGYGHGGPGRPPADLYPPPVLLAAPEGSAAPAP